ncbi:hypothetical protein [Microvirga yunnanensis]|uniref:hypothetical protein n=1 Tax=Microvirga yunnanensis TaxID=2953740 RepID=UPI0021C93F0E|nr:hypothetical protein [Microvirga sp. HBU65207]
MRMQGIDDAIAVKGANVQLGDGLPVHARDGVRRVAAKSFGRLSAASVHFSLEGGEAATLRWAEAMSG